MESLMGSHSVWNPRNLEMGDRMAGRIWERGEPDRRTWLDVQSWGELAFRGHCGGCTQARGQCERKWVLMLQLQLRLGIIQALWCAPF